QALRFKPGLEVAVQDDDRLATLLVDDLAEAPAHGHPHAKADGLAESLLGGEARRQVTQPALRPAGATCLPDREFGVAQDLARETLALAFQGRRYAPDVADVGTDTVDHLGACSPAS